MFSEIENAPDGYFNYYETMTITQMRNKMADLQDSIYMWQYKYLDLNSKYLELQEKLKNIQKVPYQKRTPLPSKPLSNTVDLQKDTEQYSRQGTKHMIEESTWRLVTFDEIWDMIQKKFPNGTFSSEIHKNRAEKVVTWWNERIFQQKKLNFTIASCNTLNGTERDNAKNSWGAILGAFRESGLLAEKKKKEILAKREMWKIQMK